MRFFFIGARVLAPMTGTLIQIVDHLIDTDGSSVRILLPTILGIQVHDFRLIAADHKLRLKELFTAADVPAAVTRQRSVAAADSCVDH